MSSTKRGSAVGGGAPEPQPLALADREAVGAVVAAEHLAGRRVDDRRRRGWAPGRRASRAASRRCRRRRRSRCRGCPACRRPAARAARPPARTSGLVESPSGNSEWAQLLLVEHAEHVGLVLAGVDRPVHLDQPVGSGAQLGVVAGGDGVEAERERPVEHGRELDLLVAAQAGVGRPAGGVLAHEVLDDVLVEAVAEVPDVERDADHVGGAAGVVAVLDGAAAAGPGAVGLRVAGQGEVDAGDVVAGLDRAGRSDRGVDAAGHGSDDPHRWVVLARSTTGPIASTRASTSAAVLVWPSEKRSECRAGLVGAAHREQDVRGLGHAGRARRAGRALDPAGVEQHQQRVALAVGEAEVGVARAAVPGSRRAAVRAGGRRARPRSPGAPGRRAARRPARAWSACCFTATSTAAANPAIAGVSMVPGPDVALLATAVHQRRPGRPHGRRRARRRRRARPACARSA